MPHPHDKLRSTVVNEIRHLDGWFTVAALADRIGYSPRYVAQQLHHAQLAGLVEWRYGTGGRGWPHEYRRAVR